MLKNRFYKGDIISRFMTKDQQKEFQENYDNAKVTRLGSSVADKLQFAENKFVSVGK